MEQVAYTNQPFHLNEQKYYAVEPDIVESGAWKNYDDKEFLHITADIGRATTGAVKLAAHKKSNFVGIMKVVEIRRRFDTQQELNMLKISRDCPYLIRLIDGFLSHADGSGHVTAHNIYLEYAPFKSLDHLTTALMGVGFIKSRIYGLEIAYGLDFLHSKNIMHRDVKPENVFIRSNGHVALGDLGLAMDATRGSTRLCGTFLTRPPEVWVAEKYSLPADMWMYGVTLYNIISNKWPFAAALKEKQIIRVKECQLGFTQHFCTSSTDLLARVIQADPSMRLTIKEVLKHKYFEDLEPPLLPPLTPQELLNTIKYSENEKRMLTNLISQNK